MSESHASTRRRPPVWLWVVAGVLMVGIAATAALLAGNRGGGPVPEASVITLPVPTPTVSAIARDPGTPFYDALPSTVLAFALSASADSPDLLAAGALEAYRMEYTDGTQTIVVQAGQWPNADDAGAAYTTLLAPLVPEGTTPADQGAVTVDGTDVGHYTLIDHGDGTSTMVWTNTTAVLKMDGPSDALRDVYAAFSL